MIKPTLPKQTIVSDERVSLWSPSDVFKFLSKHKNNLDKVQFVHDIYYEYDEPSLDTAEFRIISTDPNPNYEEELKQYNIDLAKYKSIHYKSTEDKINKKQLKINENLKTNANEISELNKQINSLLKSKNKNPIKVAQLNLSKTRLEVKKEKLESDLVMLDKELLSIKGTNGK